MKYLLDTDICVYLIKKKPEGICRHLKRLDFDEVGVSSLTVAELRYGAAKSQAKAKSTAALEKLLATLKIIPFDAAAAECYGEIRAALEKKGTPIGPLDLLIAAQAVSLDAILATNNTREFKRVPGLKCLDLA